MNTQHLLLEKSLKSLPRNWKEWLDCWNMTDDPLALLSLLHHGPKVDFINSYDYKNSKKVDILYLRLAKNFWEGEQVFSEKPPYGGKPNIFNCPRRTLTRVAFKALCKYGLEKTESDREPWKKYLGSKDLLKELLIFLGVDSIDEPSKSGLHSLCCYARGKKREIIKEFCLGLAKHLIEMPFHDCEYAYLGAGRKSYLTRLWRQNRKSAVMILWYFDELENVLVLNRNKVDRSILNPMRDIILIHDVIFHDRRKPKDVKEVIKMRQDNYFWCHNCDLMKAAYLYLALTS